LEGGGIPLLFTSYQQSCNQTNTYQNSSILVIAARGQTGNGANFSLFWEREVQGILPKKAEVIISGALFLWFVSFWTNKKK
jgi:hypothetical protein